MLHISRDKDGVCLLRNIIENAVIFVSKHQITFCQPFARALRSFLDAAISASISDLRRFFVEIIEKTYLRQGIFSNY
jgi:hypothetical protein